MAILRPSEYFTPETITDARRKGLDIAERQQRAVEREQEKKGLATAFGTLDNDDPYAAAKAKQHTLEAVQWGATYLTELYEMANKMSESGDAEAASDFFGPNVAKLQELLPPEATAMLNIDKIRDIKFHPNFKDSQFVYLDPGKDKKYTWDNLYDEKTQRYDRSVPIKKAGWYLLSSSEGGWRDIQEAANPSSIAATAAAQPKAGKPAPQYDYRKDPLVAPWVKQFDKSVEAMNTLRTDATTKGKLFDLTDKKLRSRAKSIAVDKWQAWMNVVKNTPGTNVKDLPFTKNTLVQAAKLLQEENIDTEAILGFEVEDWRDLVLAFEQMGVFESLNYPFASGEGGEEGINQLLTDLGLTPSKKSKRPKTPLGRGDETGAAEFFGS